MSQRASRPCVLGGAEILALAALLCALGSSGCGPAQYIANVPFGAAGAFAEAQHLDAEKYAPYEVTAAREYLRRSRELAGYARFHSSVGFARKSERLSHDARKLVEQAAAPSTAGAPAAPTPASPPTPAADPVDKPTR